MTKNDWLPIILLGGGAIALWWLFGRSNGTSQASSGGWNQDSQVTPSGTNPPTTRPSSGPGSGWKAPVQLGGQSLTYGQAKALGSPVGIMLQKTLGVPKPQALISNLRYVLAPTTKPSQKVAGLQAFRNLYLRR